MPRAKYPSYRKAYFIGSRVASLAGAAFLIRHGQIPGEAIHIYEELNVTGGSLDNAGNKAMSFVIDE